MLLGGLWHGAGWNFAFWGLLHGLGLAVNHWWEDYRRKRKIKARNKWWGKLAGWAATYAFVSFCWIFFRAQSFGDAMTIIRKIFGIIPEGLSWINEPLFVIVPLVILAHWVGWRSSNDEEDSQPVLISTRVVHVALLFFWVVGIFFLAAAESTPFIYFQF
jgi:hypothetical protein